MSAATEDDVLGQAGVFMLFYEREVTLDHTTMSEQSLAANGSAITPSPEAAAAILSTAADDALDSAESTDTVEEPPVDTSANVQHAHTEAPRSPLSEDSPLTGTTTEDESEATDAERALPVRPVPKLPSQPWMRTSRGRRTSQGGSGFENAFRAVAAT